MLVIGNLHEVHIFSKWNIAADCLQNVEPIIFAWKRDVEKLVQSARSEHGRINYVWSIGSSNDKDATPLLKAIHFRQKLIYYPLGRSVILGASLWAQTIEFVKEDDARCRRVGSLKQLPDGLL